MGEKSELSLIRAQPRILRRLGREANPGDLVFRVLAMLFAATVIGVVLLMVAEMAQASKASLSAFGLHFIVSQEWDPVREVFGALPFVYGTVVSSMLAVLISVPVSLGVAIFLTELSPLWLRAPLSALVELLAAVPSVVYGLWGIFGLAPFLREHVEPALASAFGFLPLFQGPHQGYGMLTGGVILAIMILPTIASVSREVLYAVPNSYREGALALGATQWESLRDVVLPFARSGLIGAVILGLGRALGETMAVTMVIGNSPEIKASLFAPSYTMASVIANEFAEATSDLHLASLAEIGLLLFGVTFLLNVVARLLVWRVAGPAGGAR
ncbi:MAG TPA: phosphate ABC transporter permease subunit PstC [Polyangiaceae bacterium]|nr:phosphate ABC transporter permease subunit PstC [Polyangiaceae bacterium]